MNDSRTARETTKSRAEQAKAREACDHPCLQELYSGGPYGCFRCTECGKVFFGEKAPAESQSKPINSN